MKGYNIKGVTVARVSYQHDCKYEGCKRAAYYKFSSANAIGKAYRTASLRKRKKALRDSNGKDTGKYEEYDYLPWGSGYYCSFDCARKDLLVKTFEAKVKLTPLVKDFLGQGTVPITDHETIMEDEKEIHFVKKWNNKSQDCYLKVSPNGIPTYPIQLDVSINGHNEPVGFTVAGAKKLISSLQTIVNEWDTVFSEQAHMSRRKKIKLDKPNK